MVIWWMITGAFVGGIIGRLVEDGHIAYISRIKRSEDNSKQPLEYEEFIGRNGEVLIAGC